MFPVDPVGSPPTPLPGSGWFTSSLSFLGPQPLHSSPPVLSLGLSVSLHHLPQFFKMRKVIIFASWGHARSGLQSSESQMRSGHKSPILASFTVIYFLSFMSLSVSPRKEKIKTHISGCTVDFLTLFIHQCSCYTERKFKESEKSYFPCQKLLHHPTCSNMA